MNIFIQHTYLIAGGIEVSMLNFLKNMKEKNDIDLFLFKNVGILKNSVPESIKVMEADGKLKNTIIDNQSSKTTKKENFILKTIKSFLKLFGVKKFYQNLLISKQRKQEKKYDVAICFNGLNYLNLRYILKKVDSTKKIAFIHSDVKNVKIKKDVISSLIKFDKILCVSESCANVFKEIYPNLADKVDYLYNFQNIDEIKKKSGEFEIKYSKNILNIVSVSRLSTEKAHLRTLGVLKRLKDEGYNFCWHIVGDGENKEKITKYIEENNLQDFIKLYGNQVNPYPYIRSADLFFLGSNHEAAPMVFAESMTLKVPVLTTETRSAKELVGEFGFVCENNEESIYKYFKDIFDNRNLLMEKQKLLKNYEFDNELIKTKFAEILYSLRRD